MQVRNADGKANGALNSTSASRSSGVRHTKEDALGGLEFELLVDASYDMKRFQDLETRFVLLVCGRLGLRRSELAHMQEEWIDWRDRRIVIPSHEPCDQGRDGDICGICKQHARQKADHAIAGAAETVVDVNRTLESDAQARLRDFDADLRRAADGLGISSDELLEVVGEEMSLQPAEETLDKQYYDEVLADRLARRWEPKTDNAARSVPFGFSGRTEIVIDRYFDEFSRWMYAGNALNRRLNWVAEDVDAVDTVGPHILRATAATYHAGRGLETLALQNLMGWADPATAERYVAANPDNLDRQLQFAHR